METIGHSLFRNFNLNNLLAQNTQGSLDPQLAVYSRTKAKAEIEITTAEGDRVTLFSKSRSETMYASYDSQGNLTGAETSESASTNRIVTTNDVAIAVEGNLSEEEIADIQKLLQSVEDMFTNYLYGNGMMEEDMVSSLSLDSMKTLSHFDADLKYSQKIKGYGITTGSSGETPLLSAQESASDDSGLVSGTDTDVAPDVATMIAFKAKTKASMHISGTRLSIDEPVQAQSQEVLPEDGASASEAVSAGNTGGAAVIPATLEPAVAAPATNSLSIMSLKAMMKASVMVRVAQTLTAPAPADASVTGNQAADASSATSDTLSSLSAYRTKLVEEFSALIRQSTVAINTISTVLSQFIPALIEQLSNNKMLDESQQGMIQRLGSDIIDTSQNITPQ
ncbi:MAG: hypothetical protein IT393_11840 [Nitrospirae bacterium]|nr:hypothetical protein [Nitrospirota bacterium]